MKSVGEYVATEITKSFPPLLLVLRFTGGVPSRRYPTLFFNFYLLELARGDPLLGQLSVPLKELTLYKIDTNKMASEIIREEIKTWGGFFFFRPQSGRGRRYGANIRHCVLFLFCCCLFFCGVEMFIMMLSVGCLCFFVGGGRFLLQSL